MSNIKRLSVGILLLGIALAVGANAQDADKQDAKAATQILRGQLDEVSLNELVLLYSTESGRTVVYNPKVVTGNLTFRSPLKGSATTAENMLRAGLAELRLTLVPRGEFDAIIPMAEAITECETVSVADLAAMPPLKFARIVYHLKNNDANAVRGALQNLTSRQGGVVNPVISRPGSNASNALIICDFAENLIELVKVLEDLDTSDVLVSEVLTLKHTKTGDIGSAVLSAAGTDVSVGLHGNERMIVLTGKRDNVKRVRAVVEALDVKLGD